MPVRKGHARVRVDIRLCKGVEGCRICIRICPEGVLGAADGLSHRGVHPAAVLHPDRCTGCGLCMIHCPDLAVTVEREEAGEHG